MGIDSSEDKSQTIKNKQNKGSSIGRGINR
jgi:hypothetical protein